jgi:hypothetical protein
MAHSNGCVGVAKEIADWATDNVTSPNHNGGLASEADASLLEENHDSLRGARGEKGVAALLGELADVLSAEPIDVLLVSNCRGNIVL